MKKKGIIILNKDFSREWLPILKESGINTIGFHSLYQFGGMEGHLDWLLNEDTQKLIAEFEANGFEIEHQLHAVDWLLPRSFFKLHPEWFRVNDKGERVNDWNLCVSNREALSFLETSAYKLRCCSDKSRTIITSGATTASTASAIATGVGVMAGRIRI